MSVTTSKPYRPKLHFSPQQNWMNDPNGLVYFEGEYHLFYQYHPESSVWGPMHWGHAVSKDLIAWEELEIALFPDQHGTIFSGSIVVDWENTSGFFEQGTGLVAIFTQHLEREEGHPIQTQSLAYSSDKGRTWKVYEGNPVLKDKKVIDFRDPKVIWHAETSRWIMSLATGDSISFYSSSNLKEWKYESQFHATINGNQGVWECPDLFPLQTKNGMTKWVLIISLGDDTVSDIGSHTYYALGTFDGHDFKAEQPIMSLDLGMDNYAGVSFSDIPSEDGRRIYLGWMSNWRYANQLPTDGWRGQMTMARSLSLIENENLFAVVQKPVEELHAYTRESVTWQGEFESNEPIELAVESNNVTEFVANFMSQSCQSLELIWYHTEEQFTKFMINVKDNELSIDRAHSGRIDFSPRFAPKAHHIPLEVNTSGAIRLIGDSSSLELYLGDGAQAATTLVFPDFICEKIVIQATGTGQAHLVVNELIKPE